jgi:hypothetical protein
VVTKETQVVLRVPTTPKFQIQSTNALYFLFHSSGILELSIYFGRSTMALPPSSEKQKILELVRFSFKVCKEFERDSKLEPRHCENGCHSP